MACRLNALTADVRPTPLCSLINLVLHPMQGKRKREPRLWSIFFALISHKMGLVDADEVVGVIRA